MALVTAASAMPTISTVFLRDQQLHHARCGQSVGYLGQRQGIELVFYCRTCHERVTLPEYVLDRIPSAS